MSSPAAEKMFEITIVLINEEIILKTLNRKETGSLRNTIWLIGTYKTLANDDIELISPLIIKTVIIKQVK